MTLTKEDLEAIGSLVDEKFAEFEVRIEAKIEEKFAEFEVRIEAKIEEKFAEFEVRIDAKIEEKFAPLLAAFKHVLKAQQEIVQKLEDLERRIDSIMDVLQMSPLRAKLKAIERSLD